MVSPLDGIRVIECGVAIAGPLCARYLGSLGAEVIKIDNRANILGAGTPTWAPRGLGHAGADLLPGAGRNGDKKSVGLDLKAPAIRPVFERLIAGADVFVTNLSVPAVQSLRMTWDDLQPLNPRLVHLALPGFGFAPGPYREYRSWGPNLSSLSGLDHLTGDPDRPPVMTPLPLPDFVGGYHAVAAILAALLERDVTGCGQRISMAQFETTISVLGPQLIEAQLSGEIPARSGNRRPHSSPMDVFPSAGTDRWVTVEVRSDDEWAHLVIVGGMPAEIADPAFATLAGRTASADRIYDLLATWTADRTNAEAAALLRAAGIAAHPVQTSWDHLADPQLHARRAWRAVAHDRLGLDLTPSLPMTFSLTPPKYDRAVPSFGHDTRDVLREQAGLDDAAIDALVEAGNAECEAPFPDGVTVAQRPSRKWAWPLLRVLDWPAESPPDIPETGVRASPSSLKGTRIVDLSDEVSAYGTYLLALAGAEVIRIESPTQSALATRAPVIDGISTAAAFFDAGKTRRIIDLDSEGGRGEFADLLRGADVLYESTPFGHLDRFGFGDDALLALNPALCHVAVTPFGRSGPYRDLHAGELGLWALSGMLPITGYPDQRPVIPGGDLAANFVGTAGAIGVLAALKGRNATGFGQHVDVSAQEVMVFTCSGLLGQIDEFGEPRRAGRRALGAAPYGIFACTDRLISLLALYPGHWDILASWIREKTGTESALDEKYRGGMTVRMRNIDEVEALVSSLTALYPADDFCREAQGRGIPAMPVNSVADLLTDPHLAATAFWRTATVAGREIRWPGPPFRLEGMD